MNTALLQPKVQAYLEQHKNTDIHSFILKGSPFTTITVQELAQQLEGKRKTRGKLPLWHTTKNILFPHKLNLEQTSSQITAQYKASLLEGKTVADGTGGFGIDAYHFAQKATKVIHIEMNEELSTLAKVNAKTLNQENITFITGDSLQYFTETSNHFDTIFLDPGRRTDVKGKVFMLKDCLPNVPLHKDMLLSKCDNLWIKTAPILDITAGLRELENVAQIHIVAVKNEVKELLWNLKPKKIDTPQITVVNLETKDPVVTFNYEDIFDIIPTYGKPSTYLYEPNAALMKSGAFNWISTHFKIEKLHEHSHLYTSKTLKAFPGRRFNITQQLPYSKKTLKTLGILKANITTRNFPLKVEEIRKKHKIKDGGDCYLFFTTLEDGALTVLMCNKI